MSQELIQRATDHIRTILDHAILFSDQERALVVFDEDGPLAHIITEAYRAALPQAQFLLFKEGVSDQVRDAIFNLQPKDLVVLIQSTNFRLNEFRIRIELFKRELKTIEHVHLNRMTEDQFVPYIDSLAYDGEYYRSTGKVLKEKLDTCQGALVECSGTSLVYEGPMESAKLNIGDYRQMKNVGGTYPIGEVFTEPKDLTMVNGEAMIFALAGDDHLVRTFTPFKVHIKNGLLTPGHDAPQIFIDIIEKIKEDEEPYVREFGLGLNRALTKNCLVNDITAYERMKGLHLSIGAKHSIYNKPGFSRKGGRYHVDVFVDIERVTIGGDVVFENGSYTV